MVRVGLKAALTACFSLSVAAACVKEPHPWELPDANIHSGYNAVVSASCLAGFLIFIVLLVKAILLAKRGELWQSLWPVSRDIGVRTHNDLHIRVPDAQCALFVMFLVLDMFFRCAPFAHADVQWVNRVSLEWQRTFQPFLVNFENIRLYLAGFILVGVLLVFVAFFAKHREDSFLSTSSIGKNAVAPESATSSVTGSTTSVTSLILKGSAPPSRLTVLGIYTSRLVEGPMFLPFMYLMFDVWTCKYSNRSGSTPNKFYTTPDCPSILPCYAAGHYVMMVVSIVIMVLLFLFFVLWYRNPLTKFTFFELGVPHLIPAMLLTRLALAWSGKILIYLDVCGSLCVSLVANTVIFALHALAVDSGKIDTHPTVLHAGLAAEVWIALYGVTANIIYGIEVNWWCPLVAILVATCALAVLGILLWLRRRSAGLHVKSKPVFTRQPVSVEGGIGSRLEFVAVAECTPAPHYQWRRDEEPLPGETKPVLVIPRASALDCVGRFTCVASNEVGQALSAPVFVEYTPTLPAFKQDLDEVVEVHRGETVTLEVLGEALPLPEYFWLLNDRKLPGHGRTLVIRSLQDDSCGVYQCVLRNSVGVTRSRKCHVSIAVDASVPTIVEQPTVRSGDLTFLKPVELAVAATGFPEPRYQWMCDGRDLEHETRDKLVIPSLTPTRNGAYSCRIYNREGHVLSKSVMIKTPPSAPVPLQQPADVAVQPGHPVDLVFDAPGNPTPSYQWRFNGEPIVAASSPVYRIEAASRHHLGAYSCTATNVHGTIVSRTASLRFAKFGPEIRSQPQSRLMRLGDSYKLRIVADGEPSCAYQWFKNGVEIEDATGSEFMINATNAAVAGNYSCTVTNMVGSVASAVAEVSLIDIVDEAPVQSAPINDHLKPTFIRQPVAPTLVAYNLPVELDFECMSDSAVVVRWFKDGEILPDALISRLSIPAMCEELTGVYHAEVANAYGSTRSDEVNLRMTAMKPVLELLSGDAPLTPDEDLYLTREALNRVAHTRLYFRVKCFGFPKPELQWFKDGKPLVSEIHSVLAINQHSTDNVYGVYECVATNELGEARSPPLAVEAPVNVPSVTEQPVPPPPIQLRGACRVEFKCSGNPPPSLQWFKNGNEIPGATTPVLEVNNATEDDCGTYTCRVRNSQGTVFTEPFEITLAATAPVIVKSSGSQDVEFGSRVELFVEATGFPKPRFQWFRNGGAVSGATNSTFAIARADIDTEGAYTCEVTNQVATVKTPNMRVTVQPIAPVITAQPKSAVAPLGQRVVLTVEAYAIPRPNFYWEKNGVRVPEANTNSFVIPSMTMADVASYVCVVKNWTGSVTTAPASVSVGVTEPSIVKQPESAVVGYDEATTLAVEAVGYPDCTYQWRRNGVNIPRGSVAAFTIPAVSLDEEGRYDCVVSNEAGQVTTAVVTVAVAEFAPRFITQPASVQAARSGPARLVCGAVGKPAPTYQWFKRGKPLPRETKAELSLAHITEAECDMYFCEASNSHGTARSSTAEISLEASAPHVFSNPISQTINLGDPLRFAVEAFGVPQPTYSWSRNGVPIPGATHAELKIAAVSEADFGEYECTISNELGTIVSTPAMLRRLPVAPAIVRFPTAVEAIRGQDVNINVEATGFPKPTYQWRKDGAKLSTPSATSATLSLLRVSDTDVGEYTVEVSNEVGQVRSKPLILELASLKPHFTRQPVASSVALGDTVELVVEASGDPAPTFKWTLDGVVLTDEVAPVLRLTDVSARHVGTYKCIVQNSAGTVSSEPARVTLKNSLPVIHRQPQPVTARLGNTATFTIQATGHPDPSFQWRHNSSNIAGETQATLAVRNINKEHVGLYTCVVTNVCGSVESDSAELALSSSAPEIQAGPDPEVEVQLGETVALEVIARGVPPPQYQWRLNGVELIGESQPRLVILEAGQQHVGSYTCRVSNIVGVVESRPSALRLADSPPKIVSQSKSTHAAFGQAVTLEIVVTGNPAPTFQWQLNGADLPGQNAATYSIASMGERHTGTYTCRASNRAGIKNSAPILLDLQQQPPSITSQSHSQTASVGDRIRLGIVATGYPQPSFTWTLNGRTIHGENQNVMTFASIQSTDFGTYVCTATNTAGSAACTPIVISQGNVPPSIFTHPTSQAVCPGDELRLVVESTGIPAPMFQWQRDGEDLVGRTESELVIRPFRASHVGRYTCRAYNDAGAVVSNPADVSAGEPRIKLRLVETTYTTISMAWDPPVVDHRIGSYVVEAKEYDDDPSDDAPPDYFEMSKTDFTFELFHNESIDPGESFQFRVRFRYEGSSDLHGVCEPLIASTVSVGHDAVMLLEEPTPRIYMARPLLFEKDSAKLVEDSLQDLPRVTALLKQQKHLRIVVEGHVNFGPTRQSALKLSASRAEAVMNKLIDQGIAALRLSSGGFGWDRPRFPRGSRSVDKNRRVEFRVVTGREKMTHHPSQRRLSPIRDGEGAVIGAAAGAGGPSVAATPRGGGGRPMQSSRSGVWTQAPAALPPLQASPPAAGVARFGRMMSDKSGRGFGFE